MNRLYQLERTLRDNLDTIGNSEVEIILVNYNSRDNLDAFIKERFSCDINSGKLVYGYEREAAHYHSSRAKNIAHRLASGDILVNLDCDNFIRNNVQLVQQAFTGAGMFVHFFSGNYRDGTHGRIALWRNDFYDLCGYDESFHPVAFQDEDLINRACAFGLIKHQLAVERPASILNTREESVLNSGSPLGYKDMHSLNKLKSIENISKGVLMANNGQFGRAKVTINFSREVQL
jgi:hypothetical protein